jgi:hypothetical protein
MAQKRSAQKAAKKPARAKAAEAGAPGYEGFTPNQVVAHNLALARQHANLTQDQAAEALEPYLGRRWSKASLSQAERSVAGKVICKFDADEIVAFARGFNLPIAWFFMLPHPDATGTTRLATPDAEHGETLALLIDLVFGDDYTQAILELRLRSFLEATDQGLLTTAQQRIANLARARADALVDATISDLGRWQTQLRALANQLEDVETRAKLAIAKEREPKENKT